MADIGIVSNTTTHLIPEKGQPHCNNEILMLLVRHLHDDGTLDCSLISTQVNDFKVLRQDDNEILNLLREDCYYPTSCTFYSVVATCNSWMLLSCSRIPEFDFLWNPTTGERIALPYFALASEILSDSWAYGLMFDPARKLWKVLRSRVMDKYDINEEIYVELLSSASDSWKKIPDPRVYFSPCQEASLYINGFYYWPTKLGFIVRFDFAEERFGALIPGPKSDKFPNARVSNDAACLVEYDASLASVVFKCGGMLKKIPASAETKRFSFEIWVWKEASATWSCLSSGEIPVSDDSVNRVLGLYKKRKLLLERSCGNLWVYDVETKALDNLGIRGGGMDLMVFPYVANAEASCKSSWKNRSSGSTCTVDGGVPATIRAHTRALKPNDCGGLMLMVQCVLDWTRIYSVISMENNNSFKVLLQEDDDDNNNLLRNLSRLVPENYDIEDSMNAKYHVLACCNTWMLWEYTEIPSDPDVLLWDPKTDVLLKLPFFRAKPRKPHPVFECMWGYGIGFDPCAAPLEYKVVRCRVFEYFRSSKEAHAELFSFETWKEIPYPHDLQWEVFQDPSLFIDGFYYWTAKHPAKEGLAIISFDFAKEEFPHALIPMPISEIVRDITCDCVCIAELHGLLAAIVFVNHGQSLKKNKKQKQMETEEKPAPFVFEIYVWEKGSWYHRATHEFFHPNPAVCMRVVGLYKNDKVFLEDSEGYLRVYSLKTSTPMLEKVVGIRDDKSSLKIFPFV